MTLTPLDVQPRIELTPTSAWRWIRNWNEPVASMLHELFGGSTLRDLLTLRFLPIDE